MLAQRLALVGDLRGSDRLARAMIEAQIRMIDAEILKARSAVRP